MGQAKEKDPIISPAVKTGRQVLLDGAEALRALAQGLGAEFERAVDLVLKINSTGRIIVCGMGKAGFVGMKFSATLASIGVPSFFVSPAEAAHGDMGRFTKEDIVIIFSNSGETPEILNTLGQLRLIGSKIISITSAASSSLSKYSEITLLIGENGESGPHGLAPTTSTTSMLALGDALAMAVFDRLGSPKDKFAFFHPGGSLGRALVQVSKIMRTGEEHCVVQDTASAKEVLHQITATKGRPGCASIIDGNGKLVGIFTDGDFRRCLDSGTEFLGKPISEVMGKSPKTISPDALAQDALKVMSERRIDQLIVVDSLGRPIGLVDIQDVA